MATIPVSIPKGRIRAPFTGVPVPGERPLIVHTERLRVALDGVKVTDAAVVDTVRASGGYQELPIGLAPGVPGERVRALEVTFTHGKRERGRGRVVLYDLGYSKDGAVHRYRQALIANLIRIWAEGQRKNSAKKLTGNGTVRGQRIAQAIRKLEKEKSGIYQYKKPPLHPLLPSDYRYEGHHYRDTEWRWHDERFHRKQLAALAGRRIRCLITSTTAYKLLREMGHTFKKFSELRTHDRDRRPNEVDYWKHLPEFCGFMGSVGRPTDLDNRLDDEGRDRFQQHAVSRVEFLERRRQAESLDIQIAELRRLAAEDEGGASPKLKGGSLMTVHGR